MARVHFVPVGSTKILKDKRWRVNRWIYRITFVASVGLNIYLMIR